jgi:hypothetical protein
MAVANGILYLQLFFKEKKDIRESVLLCPPFLDRGVPLDSSNLQCIPMFYKSPHLSINSAVFALIVRFTACIFSEMVTSKRP